MAKKKAAAHEASMDLYKALTADKREKGVASPALTAFRMMVELTPEAPWRDVGGSRYNILKYATQYLDFDPEDVKTISSEFDGRYWRSEFASETLYKLAIQSNNASACVAWETFLGRNPWWYLEHLEHEEHEKRSRAHVGSQVRVDEDWHTITSFREDYVNARRHTDSKMVRLTREQMAPPKEA